MSHILILGETGQVASALQRRLGGAHRLTVAGRARLDLSDPDAAHALVASSGADVVINAAAYTAVDRAETEVDAARALNATGPAAAARAAADLGIAFIHFSTDYVFDGSKGTPYVETDPVRPLGVYGATKLEGEQAIAGANPRHVILRTAWVCSPDGSNFLKTMLRLAGQRDEIGVVDDQRGQPTFADDLADVAARVVDGIESGDRPDRYGVFHATGEGDTTWCGVARAIMAGSAARGGPSCRVNAITSADYPTPVRRPADSRLDGSRLEQVYGIRLPHWHDALDRCLDTIYQQEHKERDA
jgi:dTDP-4-dehydrorhamnose reductase